MNGGSDRFFGFERGCALGPFFDPGLIETDGLNFLRTLLMGYNSSWFVSFCGGPQASFGAGGLDGIPIGSVALAGRDYFATTNFC